MLTCFCFGLWGELFRINLSAHNSQGFGPSATVTVETLDHGECYASYWGDKVVASQGI